MVMIMSLLLGNEFEECCIIPGAWMTIADFKYGSCSNGEMAKSCGVRTYYDNGLSGVVVTLCVEECCTESSKVVGPNVTCIVYNFVLVVTSDVRDCSGTSATDEVPDTRACGKILHDHVSDPL